MPDDATTEGAPGAALDAEVGRVVFDLDCCPGTCVGPILTDGTTEQCTSCGRVIAEEFSSDASWEGLRLLVGRLRALGLYAVLIDRSLVSACKIYDADNREVGRSGGVSIPHATSLAALRALAAAGGNVGEEG